jgi:hypothetical protein
MSYVTVQDVRDAGLTDAVAFPDATVLSSISIWQALIDRACRQWFEPKALTIKADGTDSDTLHFGIPIISVEYVKLNNNSNELDTNLYRVYNSISMPDDRRNPRIKLVKSDDYRDIYTAPGGFGDLRFRKGRQNQEIKGSFGFVEEDGSVPLLIQRALIKLVIEKLTKPIYVSDPVSTPTPPPPIIGSIQEEWTDGHKIKYGQSGAEVSKRSPYLTGITDDQEIIEIIKLYRAPIGCATPAHSSYK